MGWLEIDNVSKLYRRRRAWFSGAADVEEDEDIDPRADDRPGREDEDRPLGDATPPRPEEVWALQDISLRINAGDAVAIVGLTGSGKTTLIKLLAGLTLPTSGEVRGQGFVIPLNYLRSPILGSATGRRNLALLESLLGMPKGQILDRAKEIAAFAELESQLDQRVSEYSSSMYTKLALSAGLFCDPGVLLVDDGISGGDQPFRTRALAKLEEVVKQGATLIYASQTPSGLAIDLCRRAVWLSDGRIVSDGLAKDVFASYEAVGEVSEDEWADSQSAIETGGLEADQGPANEPEPETPWQGDVRLVPQQGWLAKVSHLDTRWRRRLEQWRATPAKKQRPPGFYRAELSPLAKVIDIRVIDSEGQRITIFPPGEPLRVELEVEVSVPETEISIRIEMDTRGQRLFESNLPLPFCASDQGCYLFSFPLEPWLMEQEVENLLFYKIRSRTFFRKGTNDWQYMDAATAYLLVRGSLRERFLMMTGAAEDGGTRNAAPAWLDGATPRPSEEVPARKPLLRPRLDWQVHRLERAVTENAKPENPSDMSEEPRGQTI